MLNTPNCRSHSELAFRFIQLTSDHSGSAEMAARQGASIVIDLLSDSISDDSGNSSSDMASLASVHEPSDQLSIRDARWSKRRRV